MAETVPPSVAMLILGSVTSLSVGGVVHRGLPARGDAGGRIEDSETAVINASTLARCWEASPGRESATATTGGPPTPAAPWIRPPAIPAAVSLPMPMRPLSRHPLARNATMSGTRVDMATIMMAGSVETREWPIHWQSLVYLREQIAARSPCKVGGHATGPPEQRPQQ